MKEYTFPPEAVKRPEPLKNWLQWVRGFCLLLKKNEGCPNKDLDRFAREIQSLCDKWDRKDG